MKFNVEIKNGQNVIIKLKSIPAEVHKQISRTMKRYSNELTRYFRNTVLNGSGVNGTLKSRSGKLRRETVAYYRDTKTSVSAGVTFKTPYAFRHIKLGNYTATTIKPIRASMLAIPIKNRYTLTPIREINRLGYGSSYTPIREKFPFLFRIGSTLFGKKGNALMPFYSLKRSVRIKVRVFPDRIMRQRKGEVVQKLVKAIKQGIEVK